MSLSFQTIATVAAIICLGLTIVWLIAPQRLLSIWGVTYSHPVGLVSRRGAALFLGIGVMFFLARNAEPSASRAALSAGFIVACLALASLGIVELATKRARIGILSAVLVELILAGAFLIQISSR
jgi:hypothetical protein